MTSARALDSMIVRPELAFVPGSPLTKGDLGELVESAW